MAPGFFNLGPGTHMPAHAWGPKTLMTFSLEKLVLLLQERVTGKIVILLITSFYFFFDSISL